jgi:CelD/BcsL family acetyltransferase involved in cellulose biosynthesis
MSVDVLRVPFTPTAPSASARALLRVETIQDPQAFAALRDDWNGLLRTSASDTVFLTWEWLHTWWQHQAGDARLSIQLIRRGAELLAIAPLVSRGRGALGVPRLSFLGTGRVGSDYLDLIVKAGAEDEATSRLSAHLLRLGARLDLAQLRIASSAAGRLARELRVSGCQVRVSGTHRCPYIDLGGGSFDAYLKSLGSEHRYNFQRKLRKLEAQPGFAFERVTSERRRRELLPVLFELHRQRWSERGGSDGLAGPGIQPFHEEWTRLALAQGWLRLFVLWLGGAPAAAFYGFRYGRVFSFYQSGFDERFAKHSVGLVSMGLAIRSAIEEGASEFDLLHGEEEYKSHWAKESRCLGRIVSFPKGPLGRLSWAGDAGFDCVRKLARKLPPRVLARISAARQEGRV